MTDRASGEEAASARERGSDRRRVVLVTGSTDGLGKATALALARAGMQVIVHGRNRPRVDAAVAELNAAAPGAEIEGVSFDLGTLGAVRTGAKAVIAKAPALDVLINNAGIFAGERVVNEDGIEMTFAVNHVGPFLLTEMLVPALKAAGGGAKIINVSSIAHGRGKIDLEDLGMAKSWSGYASYAASKLAQVMHALSLADRHAPAEIVAYSIHPGVVMTKLLRQGFGPVRGATVDVGAQTAIDVATGKLSGPSGAYFSEGVETPPADAALDRAARDALWQKCAAITGAG
jgi:NAD(P)-dependent dehydrogenase (short-subunit alcohol dehydrogenase family)